PYGPRARVAAVVPAMVERALRGEPLTVAGDGSQGRRFVYVEDLAEGIVAGLRPVAGNRVYNLAGTETTTIPAIAQTVRDLLGSAAAAGVLAWGAASDDSFSAFASLFGIRPVTAVRTSRPEVGVLIDAPASIAVPLSAELERDGGSASIATNGEVNASTVAQV